MEDKLDPSDIEVNQPKPILSHGNKIKEKNEEEEEKSHFDYLDSHENARKIVTDSNKKTSDDIS
jgi:hypothetical protein